MIAVWKPLALDRKDIAMPALTNPSRHARSCAHARLSTLEVFEAPRPRSSHGSFRIEADGPSRRIVPCVLKTVVFLIVVLLAGTVVFYGARGWGLREEALSEATVEQKVAQVRSSAGYVRKDDVSETYFDALVAVEDRRFYSHAGVDPIACVRALVNDIRAGAIVEGGSTITQQLAKNLFFSQEQTVERKIAEAIMAFEIEGRLTKDEILELYANSVYFGDGHYGILAASQGYFGKEPSALSDEEAIMLAGLPNAPSVYSPSVNPDLAAERQAQVAEKLRLNGNLE